ncbi:MAG TPA: hypothetical protein VMF69_16075, partial [Gemmataceae bacterium]|nr:hypothetical protein [Gemmataceae bacterium]
GTRLEEPYFWVRSQRRESSDEDATIDLRADGPRAARARLCSGTKGSSDPSIHVRAIDVGMYDLM